MFIFILATIDVIDIFGQSGYTNVVAKLNLKKPQKNEKTRFLTIA